MDNEDKKNSAKNIDVSYVASLARIRIEDSEKQKLQDDMNEILGYINILSELNIEGVEPTMHACDVKNVWREDVPEKKNIKEYFIANAPENVDNDFVKVPQVIPGEEEA